jgi:hypothetical protein
MTTSSEPPASDVSGTNRNRDAANPGGGIEDDQLPEELRPNEDNPLASPDDEDSEGARPERDDDVVPEGQTPPGEPSIG